MYICEKYKKSYIYKTADKTKTSKHRLTLSDVQNYEGWKEVKDSEKLLPVVGQERQ